MSTRLHPAIKRGEVLAFRGPTLSAQIITQVREALFAREMRPGDFLGTEKDLAERFGVSRIVARDALRTLEALGIVEIKVGTGGGARIAHGNPRLFAEALAVQLDLTGVTAAEIMDAQRAIEMPRRRARRRSMPPQRIMPGCARSIAETERDHRRRRRPSPGSGASSISRSPKPRTIACSWCSSFRCSTYRGRCAIRH